MVLACPNCGGRYGGGKFWLAPEVRRRSLARGTRERSAREKEKNEVETVTRAPVAVEGGRRRRRRSRLS
ncbi:hypothetical protein DEO72_LG2g5682 [Vigna unguiculata]|uniref:Uncharacterized protein n=1 Tax=Vigna unguiculata TaxID=3917 RepID=A0A4D6L9W7_VIGUN|nr:hypothetical protein DEO72_LG2g5682 [Vigna unguiculata]